MDKILFCVIPLKLLHSSFNFLNLKLNNFNFYHRFVAETTGRDRFQVSSAGSEICNFIYLLFSRWPSQRQKICLFTRIRVPDLIV